LGGIRIWLLVAADHCAGALLDDLHHLALQASAAVLAGDCHQHLVAIKYEVHLAGIEVHILVSFAQGNGKAVAVPVALHPTVQQVHAIDQAIGAGAVDHQLPVPLHGPQALAQGIDLLGVLQGEFFRDLGSSRASFFAILLWFSGFFAWVNRSRITSRLGMGLS
jgi:hypothetical protein